ncbi:MAG: hypothetical protein AAB434_06995 [Planctomycetota bacterium]
MKTLTAFARPSVGPVETAMSWTKDGIAEIQRVLERFPGTDGRSNDSYRYLRVKLHAYTRLRRELRSLSHLGRTALLRALRDFRFDPKDAQGEGEDVLSLVREKVTQVVLVLKSFLAGGGPLPDPTWTV